MVTNASAQEWERLLAQVPFLEPLPSQELAELARRCDTSRLEVGEELFVGPTEHGERLVLLLGGQAQVYDEVDLLGPRPTLSVVRSGTLVGLTGLVPRRSRGLHVRAVELSVLCRIGRGDFEELVRRNPQAGLSLVRLLAERLDVLEERLADLVRKEVPARLASLILRLVEEEGVITPEGYSIPTRYTHQQLATMIGSNREAVTRAFKRLREGGGVEVRRRRIHIKDIEALKSVAEGAT
jgi:CRP/FNR family transcriptional regulator